MTRTTRRTGAVLVGVGVLCLAGAAAPLVSAGADAEPGSGLGSFALSANAPVLQVREDDADAKCTAKTAGVAGCEGVVNESVSTLTNGPVGYALSSVAWPGLLGGNLGSLLIVASGGTVPDQATVLNSPIRAEARTGGQSPVVNDYPPAPAPAAAHMKAEALATKSSAEATLGAAQQSAVGSLGTSTSRTTTELTGVSAAQATAHSEVQDVTIAGVIHLGSVVSDAVATTDGSTANAHGSITVTGATIAGVPVTIDQNGVTVQTQNVPFPKQATDAVNTALAGAGMQMSLSEAHGTPVGGSVVFDSGALSLVWKQAPGQILTAVVGGAQVSVASTQAFVPPPFVGGTTGFTGGTTGGPTGGTVAPPPITSGPLPTTGGITPPTVPGQPFAPQLAGKPLHLPGGLSPWYGVLAGLGALLVMAGLRRLPDQVLLASPTACPQGDTA